MQVIQKTKIEFTDKTSIKVVSTTHVVKISSHQKTLLQEVRNPKFLATIFNILEGKGRLSKKDRKRLLQLRGLLLQCT